MLTFMKKLMFYCQHILGMGHLIRSMEIVRGLTDNFEVCFINGGEVVRGFQPPPSVQVINLPGIKSDAEFRTLQPVDPSLDLEDVKASRQATLLNMVESFRPDVLMVELFPFGRRRFSFELIPLIEAAKARKVKVVSSLRDIVVTKQDQARHEAKIVRLMNQYFDQLLIHGDPILHPLEESFSRVTDLTCDVRYTGYVVQQTRHVQPTIVDQSVLAKAEPMILVSVGGGRFGHELLEVVIQAAELLEGQLPHRIQVFTGPFMPTDKFWDLWASARARPNVHIHRYTPNLMAYMEKADLSISMAGYNTAMNVLSTGVKAMMLPFTGNGDQEQSMRAERLSQLRQVRRLYLEELTPEWLATAVIMQLRQVSQPIEVDLDGVNGTAKWVSALVEGRLAEAELKSTSPEPEPAADSSIPQMNAA